LVSAWAGLADQAHTQQKSSGRDVYRRDVYHFVTASPAAWSAYLLALLSAFDACPHPFIELYVIPYELARVETETRVKFGLDTRNTKQLNIMTTC